MSHDDLFSRAMAAASRDTASAISLFRASGNQHGGGNSIEIKPHSEPGKYVLKVTSKWAKATIYSEPGTKEEILKMGEKLIEMPSLIPHFVEEMSKRSVTPIGAARKSSGHKVKVKSIVFTYAEGAPAEKAPFLKKPVADFARANKMAREMAYYAPESSVDKTDFTVTWEDGSVYKGTLGVRHSMTTTKRPLTDHILAELKFASGKMPRPAHVKDEHQWQMVISRIPAATRAEAEKMIATLDLGQDDTVYVPKKPAGPTLREQSEAEEKRKKEEHAAKLAKYPPRVTERNEAIEKIKAALQKRSGKQWSVTGGKGTSWGWISISAPPKRLVDGYVTQADQDELRKLLSLDRQSLHQGVSVPAGSDYRTEFVDRAEGREPRTHGQQYWD